MRGIRTVFIDACWLQLGYQWTVGRLNRELTWGPMQITIPIATMEAKVYKSKRLADEAPLLRKVAALAEKGLLRLFTSELVLHEVSGGPATSLPWRHGHVFERCPPTRVESAFHYSIAFGHRSRTVREQLLRVFSNYPDRDLQALCDRLGRKHLMDCVHLITACRHGFDFFLCDRPFAQSYRSQVDSCPTWPVIPSELLRNIHEDA